MLLAIFGAMCRDIALRLIAPALYLSRIKQRLKMKLSRPQTFDDDGAFQGVQRRR